MTQRNKHFIVMDEERRKRFRRNCNRDQRFEWAVGAGARHMTANDQYCDWKTLTVAGS